MWIDLSIVFVFIVYSISVGFLFRRAASRGVIDYFLAGRTLKGWQAGLSMAATQYAADTPLLVSGLLATAGIFSLWRLWVYALAFLLMGFVLGACWRRAHILTDAELTELRYSGNAAALLRGLKAIHMGTLINCTVLAMVLLAASRITEQFLVWHEWLPVSILAPLQNFLEQWNFSLTALPSDHPDRWVYSADNIISIGVIVGFTWLYSTTGGLRSVVFTDIVQFLIVIIATAIYAVIVIIKCGGLGNMGEQLLQLYGAESREAILSFGPQDWSDATLLFLGVLAVQWFAQVNADGTGYLAQRMMGCATDRDAKKAALYFTFAQIVLRSLLWLPIIIGLLILYPADEIPGMGNVSESFRLSREGTFAKGIHDLLPVGFRGLMLTGMIAALASTVDTHLNWGASYWTNDIYKRFLMEKFMHRHPSQRELVWIGRVSNLGILIVALLLMSQLNSIQTAWHASLLFGSGLGVVLILRWLWYRINIWSEFAAGIVSVVVAPCLILFFPEYTEEQRLLIMLMTSTATVLIVTFATPPESQETLRNFYQKVQPPGFWGNVAQTFSEDPKAPRKRLGRALMAILFCAVTVFGLLYACGQLFIHSIERTVSWIPYVVILISLSVIPIWLHLGFKSRLGFKQNPVKKKLTRTNA